MQLVVFGLDGMRHALPLAAVERVVHAVAVTPLPGAPAPGVGAVDVAGTIVPVYCLRRRFGLGERPLDPADQFVLARTARRRVAVVVDQVQGVLDCDRAPVPAEGLLPGLAPPGALVQLDDGLLLIHDLEAFLSEPQERALAATLTAGA
jgi:purine-binding chemotaxis protein CheW